MRVLSPNSHPILKICTGPVGNLGFNEHDDSTTARKPPNMSSPQISRRTLGGLAAAGLGVPLLAACSGSDPGTATDPVATSPAGGTGTSSGGNGTPAGGNGHVLAKTEDIDVGGGTVFPDQEVVVTQPAAGTFRCFTAICTHQGCPVADVSGGTINCNCHGSQFSIKDGSVVSGPATFPLAEEKISISGDSISLA